MLLTQLSPVGFCHICSHSHLCRSLHHDTTRKILYLPNGKPQTQTKQMAHMTFNGQYQSLYFPDNHPMYPGHFKGMAQILKECGHPAIDSLYAQCPKFHCQSSTNNCCCHNILFNLDDFINIPCLLMTYHGTTSLPSFSISDSIQPHLPSLQLLCTNSEAY